MTRFDALIIDPNSSARGALKEILHHEQCYGENVYRSVFLASNSMEGIARITDGQGVDVILISDRIPFDEIQRFIKAAKEMEGDRGVAYIVVLDAFGEKRTAVSEGLAYGADGFLYLPCSVAKLREITEIANRVKAQAQDRLIKVALRLMVETLIDEIEIRAKKLSQSNTQLGFGRQMKDAVKRLIGDDSKNFPSYLEILEAALEKMAPRAVTSIGYQGSSKRVRKKIEEAARTCAG